jgi:hypothetical protein
VSNPTIVSVASVSDRLLLMRSRVPVPFALPPADTGSPYTRTVVPATNNPAAGRNSSDVIGTVLRHRTDPVVAYWLLAPVPTRVSPVEAKPLCSPVSTA